MKTPPILLKILHNSAAKPSPNFNKTVSRKSDAGFTLLELIVIVLILGVLSSIAVPGWLAFINRQRVRTVNDRVFQSLRLAQSEAKRTKRNITITFDTTVDPPQVKFDPPLATGGSEQKLDAGGEIKPGTIALAFNKPDSNPKTSSLVFDYQGNASTTPFVVTVAPFDTSVPSGFGPDTKGKQCAIVETIIGGMRTDEGEFNTATGQGCPVSP
jgi:prepilin-type N-terminal cleavage/methylation domain-containing protein